MDKDTQNQLRQIYAAGALQGLLSNDATDKLSPREVASLAVDYANATAAEVARRETEEAAADEQAERERAAIEDQAKIDEAATRAEASDPNVRKRERAVPENPDKSGTIGEA